MKKLILVLALFVLITAVIVFPACEPPESAVPAGPPKVNSFTVKQDTLQVGECPEYLFEVENAAAITLKEDGEVIFHIESAIPAGGGQTARKPLCNVVHASAMYPDDITSINPAGVYPVGFNGAACGKPAKAVWTFGSDDENLPDVEVEVVSPDGEMVKTELAVEDCLEVTVPPPVITSCSVYPDPCPANMAPEVKWTGWFVERVEIWQEGEIVAEDTSPAQCQPSNSLKVLGIFPVGFNGGTNGKPSKIIWKPGEEKDTMCFEVRAFNPAGSDISQCCIAISQTEEGAKPDIVYFKGETMVSPGAYAEVEWSAADADTCILSTDSGKRVVVSPQGSTKVQVNRDTTLTLTCANPYGCSSAWGTIRVQEGAASEHGWCCLKGVVDTCTKAECDQIGAGCQFFTTESEANAYCRAAP